MHEFYPLLVIGATVGVFSIGFIVAFALIKNKKEAIGFDRSMKDGELCRRLLHYAKPYWRSFVFVGLVMLLSVAYDIVSPILVGRIEETIKQDFALGTLYLYIKLGCTIPNFIPRL